VSGNYLQKPATPDGRCGKRVKTGRVNARPGTWLRARGAALVAAAAAGCMLLVAAPAAAQPSARDRARAKLVEGARLFSDGKYEAALRLFRAAQAIHPSGRIHYNIGLAYSRLGRPAAALMAMQGFLRDPGESTPELLAEAREAVDQLSKKVAFLSVSSDSPAETVLDGSLVAKNRPPSRLPIDVGEHELILRSPQLGQRARRFTARAGQTVELQIDFAAAPGNLTGASSGNASPSAATQAEALIAEATALRRAGKDARAYPLLQRAFEIAPTPRTEAQLGLVEIMLGYSLLAEKHLSEALAATRDAWIATNRAELEDSLARVRASIGEVMVTGTPTGASVVVNGSVGGTLPLSSPIRAGEGPLNLEVRAPGYASFRRSLTVAASQRAEVAVTLEKLPQATPSPPLATGSPSGSAPDDASASDSTGRTTLWRPLAWTASAGAAVGLALAAHQTLAWRQNTQRFESHVGPRTTSGQGASARTISGCGIADPNRGAAGCEAIYRDLDRSKKLAIVGFAAGGVLGAAAVTLFLLTPREVLATQVACAPAPLFDSISCRLSF
jgi:tetratricopeptide (TPR) repeat protein